MATITTYVSDDEINEFFQDATGDPLWDVTVDMSTLIRGVVGVSEGSAFSYIKECINQIFCDPALGPLTFLVNGQGDPTIFAPVAPIDDLTEVTIIAADGTEETLELTGTNRQVFWDPNTGKITLIRNGEGLAAFYDIEVSGNGQKIFPQGCENVRLIGNFGADVPSILKLAELLVMLKHEQLSNPGGYLKIGNIMSEKIGRYEYKLGAINSTGAWGQSKSLDYYIQDILDKVSKLNSMGLEAI